MGGICMPPSPLTTRLDELALGALAGDDDGTVVAAAHGVLPLVEAQSGLLNFVAMAREAFLLEERADVSLEVDFRRWRR